MMMRLCVQSSPATVFVFLLLFSSSAVFAATEVIDPAATGRVRLFSGVFTLDNPNTLTAQQLLASNIDSRVILEFSLASLTSSDTIIAVTLNLDVSQHPGPGGNLPVVPVFGYVGDGVAAIDDASVTTDLIGASDPIPGLGPISVPLDVDYITGMIGTATHLGLLLVGSANGTQAGFDNFIDAPELHITLADPGDFDADGDVDGLDFLKWQRGESPSPNSQEDLADWETNYGLGGLMGGAVAVPETTTLGLALVALLGTLARRRSAIC